MIKRIAIKNYRSLDVDFTLEPVTVIVGRSGTGKTNLIDALRFLRWALTPETVCVPENQNIFSVTQPVTEPLLFRLEFGLGVQYERYSYEVEIAQRPIQSREIGIIQSEMLKLGDQVLFVRQVDKWIHEPQIVQKPQLNRRVLALPLIAGVQEISIAHLLLTNGIGCYDFPGSVCIDESRDKIRPEAGLADSAVNHAAVLSRIRSNLARLNDWSEIVSALQQLNGNIDSVDLAEKEKNRVVVGHRMGEKVFTLGIANESEGFRRFLAHLLALYQTPAKQTLFFEEPEKGIHPGALETLAEELKAAYEDGRGQVVLTTHSPTLLDHFEPTAIRVAEMEDHVTRIGKLVPEQLEALKEDLLRPGELFTVDPARMEQASQSATKVAEE